MPVCFTSQTKTPHPILITVTAWSPAFPTDHTINFKWSQEQTYTSEYVLKTFHRQICPPAKTEALVKPSSLYTRLHQHQLHPPHNITFGLELFVSGYVSWGDAPSLDLDTPGMGGRRCGPLSLYCQVEGNWETVCSHCTTREPSLSSSRH